jgi:hypothetical protein
VPRDRFGKFCRPARANRRVDLVGRRFGRLVVVRSAGFSFWRGQVSAQLWKSVCDCGGVTFPPTHALTNGNTQSCGCLNREHSAERGRANRKHGHATTVGGKQVISPTYISWRSICARTGDNPKAFGWKEYGARGIRMSKRWRNSFAAFLKDMGARPKGTTAHRLDNAKGYFKGNVVWATPYVQNHSRSISSSEIIRKAWVTRRKNGRKK